MSAESSRTEMKAQAPRAKAEKSQAELRADLERRLYALKLTFYDALAEYDAQGLAEGTFEDKEGEAAGSGEQRKEALQNKIRSLVERAEGMRRQLDSGEAIPQMPDDGELSRENEPFMLSTFKDSWSWDTTHIKPEGHVTSPQAQNYEALSRDIDAKKCGEYTLNPETQNLDFEKLRTFVPDLTAFNGKKVHEVMQHVMNTYGATHHIPGIEYWKWLIENPGKTPSGANLKDGKYNFFPGSMLRGRGGDWRVPCAGWVGSEWDRVARWLTRGWDSLCQVVLLEK